MAIQAQMYPDNLGLPLGGSQDWLMENLNHNNYNNINNMNNNISNNINNMGNGMVFNGGCGMNGLSYNLQQKLQEQQQFQYQQQYLAQLQNLQQQQRNQNQNQSLSCDNGFVFLPTSKRFKNTTTTTTGSTTTTATTTTSSDHHIPMNFSQGLTAHIEKQSHEMDRLISLQNERLKMTLQEQRKQHLATILKLVEAKAMMMLKQKDEEIAKATNRTMELEEFVRKMEYESQTWRRVAEEREALVESLNNTLEQLKEQQQQACCVADDAESCCDDNDYPCTTKNRGNEEVEVEGTGTGEMMIMGGGCRVCKSRNASVLLLPCRHLCCCKACEAFLDSCPLCKSPKKASIEALLS